MVDTVEIYFNYYAYISYKYATVSTISDKLKAVKHVNSHLYITSMRRKWHY